MQRYMLRFSQLAIDIAVLSGAFAIAFFMRFDWRPPADMLGRLALTVPYVAGGEYLILFWFGVPRFSWRYVGLREVSRMFVALVVANAVLLGIRIAFGELQSDYAYLRHGVIPFGVLAANFLLVLLGIPGVRVARRWLGERLDSRRAKGAAPKTEKLRTLLVGAGQGGVMMAKELAIRPDLGLEPVGFIDDDPAKAGMLLQGLKVLGPTKDLGELAELHDAEQVLITMASAPGSTIRRISKQGEAAGLPVKIIPGLYELAKGSVGISRIRPVAIEDLLRRAPVRLDQAAIASDLEGKVVLVTGAGGSIGSELCRQVANFDPAKLLLVERAETSLFHIHRELHARAKLDLLPLIADITDRARMEAIFEEFRPDVVFHAAAHKHVPMMEWNPGEAIKNNVFGTRLVAELADRFESSAFVLVSTDKAVNPTNVMGATKRAAELIVQAQAQKSESTRYVAVRFGNVLGSAGSVIPIFNEQIQRGGPVTVTHKDMQRYFMTIPEACQLILQAGAMGRGGEIFILDMGEPVKIVDLAKDLIRLSGLRPGEDIEISFSGVRPGEKLFEELSVDAEQAEKTRHPKIFVGRRREDGPSTGEDLAPYLDRLRDSIPHGPEPIRLALRNLVPEFHEPDMKVAPKRERRSSEPAMKPVAVGVTD